MYLKRIETVGFKSFAEKMNITFEEGITGIVGPNGSGKSNIVDAIRWVLGEQSVKSLRGSGAMTDVIFSGSSSRKALNHAAVTLVLDNNDDYLPIDYSEVSITRRVFRSGESEYLLNGEKCRLKDITELIMDSGLGKEAFNIISQGRVQEVIAAKPEERRMIFEEAAGVLKYRKRKESALRKLSRTDDNLSRVEDIISEIESQIEPLRVQSEKAEKYLIARASLEDVEIALLANDIYENNKIYKESKKAIEELNDQVATSQKEVVDYENKILLVKNEISKLDEKVTAISQELTGANKLVESVTIKKTVLEERRKYSDNKDAFYNEQITLKEDLLKIQNEVSVLNGDLNNNKHSLKSVVSKVNDHESNIENKSAFVKSTIDLIKQLNTEREENLAKINVYESASVNRSNLLRSVKAVLESNFLDGIIDVFASLIKVDKEYSKAIETTLGNSDQFIICETADTARSAVDFLKKNRIGRATFLPLDKVTKKHINDDIRSKFDFNPGYVGIASELVSFKKKFQPAIDNQLGNVIIARDLKSASEIADAIKQRFKVVTLAGEVIHPGGSITGGQSNKKRYGLITSKFDIEESKNRAEILKRELERNEKEVSDARNLIDSLNHELSELRLRKYKLEDANTQINIDLSEKTKVLKDLHENIESIDSVLNDQVENSEDAQVISELYQAQARRDELVSEQKKLRSERLDLTLERDTYESELRALSQNVNAGLRQITVEENKFSRADALLENLLDTLNEEYEMTYEHAYENYELTMDIVEARSKVKRLKSEIRRIGPVNLDAREEYIEKKERFDFLVNQKNDLTESKDNLMNTITEMDDVMVTKFSDTFEQIRVEYSKNFKKLFAGGSADLILTNQEDLLETGIDIIAEPPGKKLSHLSLLSGGEKSLATLALLFAILKVRPVPFVILDEAEAALDEANLVRFSGFLNEFSKSTQFIVITHRKTTMEHTQSLYGVTMQESGVTKLVSVRFGDIERYAQDQEEMSEA